MKKLSKKAKDLFHTPWVKELLKNNDIIEFIDRIDGSPVGYELLGALVELGVILPHIGQTIPFETFAYLDMSKVEIPANISTIESESFRSCRYLQRVSFENRTNEIHIEDEAFANCDYLTEVILPDAVVEFDSNVFENCPHDIKLYTPDIHKIIYPLGEVSWYHEHFKEI